VRLLAAALVAGALTGALGAAFRRSLAAADALRGAVISWAHGRTTLGWLVPVVAAAVAAGLAKALVRLDPVAAGSGVQHVEAVARGQSVPAPARTVPVKFAGGLLAIGAGLALGREGPTVQMGAVVGNEVGRRMRLPGDDRTAMLVASAGAGLAVAFNAPAGGAMFVFEEVTKRFRLRLSLATLLSAAVAIALSRLLLGDRSVFDFTPPAAPPLAGLALYLALGALLGVLGAAYNRGVVASLDLLARLRTVPLELRAALVGACVGLLAWFAPSLVGGGEALNQTILNGGVPLASLALILLVRWFLGPVSYAPGTPGGLFAPLLVVGAATGAFVHALLPSPAAALAPSASALAAVGMAAFFAAVVRAPFTGILLVTEMTASTVLLVPMLAACAAATLVPTLLGNLPIYDTLRLRMLADAARPAFHQGPGDEER